MKKKVLLVLFMSLWHSVAAQVNHFSTPFIKNYQDEEYKGGTQNWEICQHPNGMILVANNDGLLEFDGTNWQLYSLGQNSMIRSVLTHGDRIYIGGQGEMGYFSTDNTGLLVYTSLKPQIPEAYKNFADVWNIEVENDRIYFNSSGRIYQYDNNRISVVQKENLSILGAVNNHIFVSDNSSLYTLQEGTLKFVCNTESIEFTDIVSLPSDRSHYLLSTNKRGLFTLKQEKLEALTDNRIFNYESYKVNSLERLSPEIIAMSTIKEGLLLLDNQGQLLQIINKSAGLQNNNVISIFTDSKQNVWLGLDHGIDFIAFNSPFYKILADGEQEGASYTAKIFEEQLYIGTSTGLYTTRFQNQVDPLANENLFKYIKGTEGQVWGMDIIDNQLFLSHNDGGFIVEHETVKKISASSGAWKFLPLTTSTNHALLGTYDGLELLEYKNEDWHSTIKFQNWKESCRILEQDEHGSIWVAHPYRGIYKVDIDSTYQNLTYELLGEKHELPSDFNNHLFNLKGVIYFTGENGIYQYDIATNKFIHNELLETLIGAEKNVIRLYLDVEENIWFVTKQETGMLKKIGNGIEHTYEKIVYPELSQRLVRGFEFIYPYDETNVFIGAAKGMIHFNPAKYESGLKNEQSINLTKVELISSLDSTLFSGSYVRVRGSEPITLQRNENAFRFSYSTSDYGPFNQISYATKLEGLDEDWSDWTTKTEREFSNLSAGTYTFSVKSRNNHFITSEPVSFSFEIKPAWYASIEILALYVIIASIFLLSLILFPARRLNKVIQVREKELAKSEEEIIQLKNAQLESEIVFKNQELASKTMHLLNRKQLIYKLEEPLNNILSTTTNEQSKTEILRIKKMLKEDTALEDDWHQFSVHFDEVNNKFLKKIKQQYPQLTTSDLKLCAYLKMNLSTKELAPLLNISIRGVETGRYRLRRKLNIDGSIDLYEFMNSI